MQTLIYRKPISNLPPHLIPFNFVSSPADINHKFLKIHTRNCCHTLKIRTLSSVTSSNPLSCGGWDDLQFSSNSAHSNESNQLHGLLNSLGIGDKKYVFVYLFGFICALAISRIKISSIIVFPAGVILFAIGFLVGLVKGGHWKELKLNGNKRKIIDGTSRGSIEKLRSLGDNLNGYNSMFMNLKNDIRRGIKDNQVTVSDLEGYVDVIESANTSFINAKDAFESCVQIALSGTQEKEVGLDHESSKQMKKSGEMGLNFSKYFNGVFGKKVDGSKPSKVKDSNTKEMMDLEVNNRKQANILTNSVVESNLHSEPNGNLEKTNGLFDNSFDGSIRSRSRSENFSDQMEYSGSENEKRNGADEVVFDQTMYSYQNNTSRFVKSQQVHLKDYQEEIETMGFQNSSYDSVDFSISMNHKMTTASFGKNGTRDRNFSGFETTEGEKTGLNRYSFKNQKFNLEKQLAISNKEVLADDLEFDRYLVEANDLLKEANKFLRNRVNDGYVENALHKSAMLLLKAIEMRPMSLLAVGQLGNTYLLHGELKLRISRELRSRLSGTDEEWFDDQLSSKDEILSALVDVCEECEELLSNAGRKYKLALSINGNDMKALYNWGLALSFRAQLIADIGPAAARDADKVFLAAIDKFDAMMSKSNVYAPDALYRWGAVLQQRSRLRPRNSKEKVKLLQQARRLYEDAINMDSGNFQIQEALSSCVSELDKWYS